METSKDPATKKTKTPKSATRYPKRMPSYVVAFAVQETHDDPAVQQIPHKRSIEKISTGARSISPTGSNNSTKTFTITPTEKLSNELNIDISEDKIDIIDGNQCGDAEKKSPQISSYLVVDNRMADQQPEVIFNASKHIKRCKNNNKFPRKKPRKNKRVIKFKNIHFKYKNSKKNITRRLEKYYEKAKMNLPNTEQIQKQIYSNLLSKVVPRSRVLKKALAKENLLDDADRISVNDGLNVTDHEDISLNSSSSAANNSFISYASQNTLTRKISSSSRNDDFFSIKTANSVIQVASDVTTAYKSDIINVAVAVAFSSSKHNNNQNISNDSEQLICKENLTSEETFLYSNTELTSQAPSNNDTNYIHINYDELASINLNEKDQSNGTLAHEQKSIPEASSIDDTFVIARTSSDFNKSSNNSDSTIISNSDTTMRTQHLNFNVFKKEGFAFDDSKRNALLLDKVIKLGFYSEMTPSTSSSVNCDSDINNVFVTEILNQSFPNQINKSDSPKDITANISVLKKSFEVENLACPKINISLPNDLEIKAKIQEAEKTQQRRTCANEVKNKFPADLDEMWEKLTLLLDLTVKRLEETLADKIIKDIKTSIAILNPHENKEPKKEFRSVETTPAAVNYDRPIPEMLHKEIFVLEDYFNREANECVQCDLVQSQVIDQLMLKLSEEGPKPIPMPTVSLNKLKSPQIVKDYFEILKPPIVNSAVIEMGRGDTVTVSTATAEFHTEEGFNKLRLLLSGPLSFIRENMFVITSVPTFFIVLLCLYGIIVIIMKPW